MQNPQYGKIRHRALDKGDFVFQVAKKAVPPPRPPDQPGDSDFSLAELEKRAKELEETKAAWNTWQGKMQKGYEDTRSYEQREVPGEWKIQAWKDFAKSFAQDNPYSTEDDTMRQTAQANMARLEKATREDQQAKERAERLAEALRQQQAEAARRCQVSGCTNDKASGSSFCSEHKCQKCNLQAVTNSLCSAHQPPKPSGPEGFTYLREKTYTCGGKSYTVKEYRHNQTGMEFVLIPGGTFEMGSNDGESNEKPVHTVTVRPFLMSKYETTQAVWQKIMQSDPSHFKGDNRPVEQVSWNDCQTFCQKTGLSLPSEAQWEYACRAGVTGKWYFGDSESQLGEYGWYGSNPGSQTHDVGGKKPNAFGLYDMSSNVWEWCQDWYHGSYNGAPRDGSAWENPTGSYRVSRGGSWDSLAGGLRSAYRFRVVPSLRFIFLGLRCVFEAK
jgi:formylglycine-generating enzyme required for sulfatase activity